MSDLRDIAKEAVYEVEDLVTDLFKQKCSDSQILLGTVGEGMERIQVQLLVTRNPKNYMDE